MRPGLSPALIHVPTTGTTGVPPVAQHKIRLYGIDASEKSQAFGAASKHHLSSLVFGKDVRVKYKSRDKYGRILGTVYVDGKDVNLEMIRAGLAWHYKRFDSTPAYAAAESEAQIDFCGKAWDSAGDIQEIRNSTNTKVSYEAAFQFFHRQLAKLGVESVDDFKSIIRAHQARELRRRQREKSATAKPNQASIQSNTQTIKYGIMSDMKGHAKSALALTLAIAGGLASPLRSAASNHGFMSAPSHMLVESRFKLMAS